MTRPERTPRHPAPGGLAPRGADRPHTLVVRLDSVGDVLLAGPAVRMAAAGSRRVTLLAGPLGQTAARLLPGVDEVVTFDAPWVGRDPAAVDGQAADALVAALAARRFDRALILTSYHQSPLPAALLLKLAGVPWVAADSEDYPGSLLQLRHRRGRGRHEARAAMDLAAAAGFALPPGDHGGLDIQPPPDTGPLTGTDPYVVVHPGATAPARAWSERRAARAVAALAGAGHRVVVTGGASEKELTAAVAGEHALDLGGRTGLHELAGVLAGARAVLVGNTGPSHLAAAVGTPVVCLFAPVVPAGRWEPFGVPHVLLGDRGAPCAGTRAVSCPVSGHPCLDGIEDAEVLAALDRLPPAARSRSARTPRTNRADSTTPAHSTADAARGAVRAPVTTNRKAGA
ncbi:glycosyltransferase family 9 protein [Streptomyces tubbatahanensis]|uniref:Glycosyltransferase family 9 protein n=1 Tax=Streptomyces tubbatahanensis TaxID=2923272 RepID=A0ABY3XRP5_9ACTN|nr:glycosyltransferase family 9 protein [Streptomyces tubbatahanensis]UNS97070.1 glycosyltransferase family 9 protein [Streptomyces tubbatahanensis]